MKPFRIRRSVPLLAALVAVAVALGWPSPVARPPSAGAVGPARLADVWPSPQTRLLPTAMPDGSTYQPMLVVDGNRYVGVSTNADGTVVRLLIWTGRGAIRQLRVLTGLDRATIAAAAVADGQLFWLETGQTGTGTRATVLWRAALDGGPVERLAVDASDLMYFDSGYDLQVVGGSVHWAAIAAHRRGEIHTVSVHGGPVRVRPLDQVYALSTWPWATTANGQPGDVTLLNLDTGERRTISGGPDDVLDCTPVWCRVTTLVDQGLNLAFDIRRADGTGRRRIGGVGATPLNTDVALLDRFEVLGSSGSGLATGSGQLLWLHDLTDGREVLLADDFNGSVGSRDGVLWWATGNNEATVWHILDLRQLT